MLGDGVGWVLLGAVVVAAVCLTLLLLGCLVSLTFLLWQQVWEQWRRR